MKKNLQKIRDEIDAIDTQLVALLNQRFACTARVAEAKRRAKIAVTNVARENDILTRVAMLAGAENADAMREIFAMIFAQSKSQQRARLGGETAHARENLTVAIVGLGLIGGSFYKAAKKSLYTTHGLHHGDDAREILAKSDLVLVCLPPRAIVPWIAAHASEFKKGALVVDICGVKESIVREMKSVAKKGWIFVGGHPMAGREVSGFAHAKADLFVGASMILTPDQSAKKTHREKLANFFATLGFAQTVFATPQKHDDMIAFTSQLCHIIATTYARDKRVANAIGFSAGSYANMTRIATQNEADWSALYRENSSALVRVLNDFLARFQNFRDAIASGNEPLVQKIIREGSRAKKRECAKKIAKKIAKNFAKN